MHINFNIEKDWTLFIDRDGVINHEKHNDYIHTWDELVFYDGVKEAFKILAEKFKYIIVVTNQRGVGKGVTKTENLFEIHRNMITDLTAAGGRVDAVYFCPDLDETSTNRKPNIGMALQAQKDFSDIDFTKSIMVGNTLSDMEFGRNLKLPATVFLTTTRPNVDVTDTRIDFHFNSLIEFATNL